jgi:hypothetical protein
VSARSRRKGADGEREVVGLAQAARLIAGRMWSLAQSPNPAERRCDVKIAGRPYQVKRRRAGFGTLYQGLRDVAGLFLRADGHDWLVVIPAGQYFELLLARAREWLPDAQELETR